MEILLEHLGCLYKFHDRPVTYLYNTLHYYEAKLHDRPPLKRRLVGAILGTLKETLTQPYQLYLSRDDVWVPDLEYYIRLVKRMVETVSGLSQGVQTDWRFNEFPNAGAHMLYTSCVELMALSAGPTAVANGLIDVVLKGYTAIPPAEMLQYTNAIGLLMCAPPKSYWQVLHERLEQSIIELDPYTWDVSPFRLFNFTEAHQGLLCNKFAYMIALAHSIWHHSGPGHIASVPIWAEEKLKGIVKTEAQFLMVCHLVSPFFPRFHQHVMELTDTLCALLAKVDKAQSELKYIEPICDLLYHLKYMYIGNSMKKGLDGVVKNLSVDLQKRLRFITNVAIDEETA